MPLHPSARQRSAIPGTHRRVWSLAWPIVLTNVSVPLLGAVDTAVVGHLSEAYYIGAVAIGAMLFTYIYHLFNCLRMGTTGPTAQAYGAGDLGEVRAIVFRALLLAGTIGGVILLLHSPILSVALWLIHASPEVERYAREYFLIRVWAMPAVLGVFAIIGWCYGLQDVRSPLVILFVTNGLNIGLDLVFVLQMGWGVPGVAAASVIAAYAGALVGLCYVWRKLRTLPRDAGHARILERAALLRMLSINTDIVLRTLCVVSVLAFFMARSAQLGDLTLAANQVLHNFLVFTSFGLDGFAHAAEAILGAEVGRRNLEAFRQGMRVVFQWALAVGASFSAAFALAGPGVIALLTNIAEVRELAAEYLLWPVLMPLISVWAYTYDGIYLAATRTRIMRNSVIASFLAFIAVLHLLLPTIGNSGLWAAMSIYLGCRGLLLHLCMPRVLRAIRVT